MDEIIGASDPYVDAALEELIRHSMTLPGTNRVTKRDTIILGHYIPKGTEIGILGNSADAFKPGFQVPETNRSSTSKAARKEGRAYGSWNSKDIDQVKPERWLTPDENGDLVFNKMAGLHLTFGLGNRGCWGRKIAQLEFRIVVCLLVWNFEFRPLEGDLTDKSFVDKMTRIPKKCFINVKPLC